ncbi:RicAFT regulatory complex protein RicA family protein [Alkalihalobacterium bogoriense]|uniref:RicAFT regulatory complex protein RicA family protein n=1 Tax=Alkalihalobacterium bogoriense TaxID=246272 RepID=UPI000478E702|nr:RicAFT regulatory complex protein RicA family protein [Alkalihalobacterium bogoriense]
MGNYTKDEIMNKARELAKMIAETEEVDFFKQAEKQINENIKVQEIIGKIKKEQKEAVNLQHYGKSEALKKVEERIDQLQDEIDDIPLVQQFKQSQTEVNQLLQLVSVTISDTVTDEIIKAMDGDLLKGTTKKNPFDGCGH